MYVGPIIDTDDFEQVKIQLGSYKASVWVHTPTAATMNSVALTNARSMK